MVQDKVNNNVNGMIMAMVKDKDILEDKEKDMVRTRTRTNRRPRLWSWIRSRI